MTILDQIVQYKRREVEERKVLCPREVLEKSYYFNRTACSLKAALLDKEKTGIIAEFKRQSPSKGMINSQAKPGEVTAQYVQFGASGLSVLTDEKYFGGTVEDLFDARQHKETPVLRKDFMIDEYQVLEAKSIGADVILLIAACLEKAALHDLAKLAKSLGLEVLMEVHYEGELEKVSEFVDIVGVNNRNLKTFEVSIQQSLDLYDKIPAQFLKISESGISTPEAIKALRDIGFQGFLMGENFMKEKDPGQAFAAFVSKLND